MEGNTRVASRASIVILGGQGTGKSTLAVIACVSMRRRLVEFEVVLSQRIVNKGPGGASQGHDREHLDELRASTLRGLLAAHAHDSIIVVPINCLHASGTQDLLKAYAETHPVILLMSNLPSKLGPGPREDEDCIGRDCCNYEYYNLCEGSMEANRQRDISAQTVDSQQSPFLNLKRVENDFLRFLGLVLNVPNLGTLNKPQIDVPLTQRSRFTYSLSLNRTQLHEIRCLEGVLGDGNDAVELRIDPSDELWQKSRSEAFEAISRDVTAIRRVFSGPIIYHVEKPLEADRETQYLALLCFSLRLIVDYLSVDLACSDAVLAQVIEVRGDTQIIGHYHGNPPSLDDWSDSAWLREYKRAAKLGCQSVRLTKVARAEIDNFAVQQFVHRVRQLSPAGPELIAYNTGRFGRLSCCFNEVLSPVTTEGLRQPSAGHPYNSPTSFSPCITIHEAQTALASTFFQDRMRLYIIGTDVSPSLSPYVYNAALSHFGIPHQFTSHSMPSIDELRDIAWKDDFAGASIAQGHKLSVLPYLSHVSPHATAIGAVNTLIPIRCDWGGRSAPPVDFWRDRNRSGPVKGLYGDNTDWIGMYRCVAKNLSPINAVSPKTTGLVIGAGGTARGAIYAMIQLGVRHVFIYNRTVTRARELAAYFNNINTIGQHHKVGQKSGRHSPPETQPMSRLSEVRVVEHLSDPWPEGFAQPTMAICCIRAPPHATGPAPNFTMPKQWLNSPNGGVVVDTGYEPLLSPLILQMRGEAHRGWVTVDGFHILPEQAAAQFELITGRRAPYIRMSIEMLRHYRSDLDPDARGLIEARLRDLCSKIES